MNVYWMLLSFNIINIFEDESFSFRLVSSAKIRRGNGYNVNFIGSNVMQNFR